ncbi:BrnA antitoxin family protein [Bradyrhizobium cytisi]|uniref:BrnA antitoxin family protein n=1 Tax=Bradyrhizobium cytisi TaxID=515489 RepID=UPI001FEC2736|nr:BrnA antitoxin family protein [Bradyrhizobium cytisi]
MIPTGRSSWTSSDAVLLIPPKKKAISIRADEDVLEFFKREDDGYQPPSTRCCGPICSKRRSRRSARDMRHCRPVPRQPLRPI